MNKKEFIAFLYDLRKDLENNPESWENKTLPEFLEAMISYTVEIDGFYKNTAQKINTEIVDFKVFSDILAGARIYE